MRAGWLGMLLIPMLVGCGTTRMTDTQRAASEMLLVSQAIDNAVAQLDFTTLQGRCVFLDTQYLDGTVDKGYLISSLRQHLLESGALIQEDRLKSTYVVEPRSGAVGTDKHSLLIGSPQVTLPSITPVPITSIPEIALVKKTDQKGVAKIAVFAYNRQTGRALWQSGTVEANSTLKDTWVFGAGPFSRGTIRKETELAGEPLPKVPLVFPFSETKPEDAEAATDVTPATGKKPRSFPNSDTPAPLQPAPFALIGITGPAAVGERPLLPTIPHEPTPPIVPAPPTAGTIQPPPRPLPKVTGGT